MAPIHSDAEVSECCTEGSGKVQGRFREGGRAAEQRDLHRRVSHLEHHGLSAPPGLWLVEAGHREVPHTDAFVRLLRLAECESRALKLRTPDRQVVVCAAPLVRPHLREGLVPLELEFELGQRVGGNGHCGAAPRRGTLVQLLARLGREAERP